MMNKKFSPKNSRKTFALLNYLEKKFKHKLLLHFHINYCKGYEYPIKGRFLATNKLSNIFKKNFSLKKEECVLRFFCHVKEVFCGKNFNTFSKSLSQKKKSPFFFVTPYQHLHDQENSYILKSSFEIKLIIKKNKLSLFFKNYSKSQNSFKKIKQDVKKILKHKHLQSDLKSHQKKRKAIHLSKKTAQIIDDAKIYLKKGECYLINITTTQFVEKKQSFLTPHNFLSCWFSLQPRFGIYYQDFNKGLACFSPERFICSKNNFILTEPIKGTLKSKKLSPTKNDAQKLWSNKKEIYEHTLIVDLMRHELYKICVPKSVSVFRPFYARKSGSLIQMQSFIFGKLKSQETLATCLNQLLPAGSITGTPKKRVCELISILEENKRGYYTGVCGLVETNDDFDSTILIRSLYLGKRGIYFGVGAGITTLSKTLHEISEFKIKLNSFEALFQEIS